MIALVGAVAVAVVLPLAAATAGPGGARDAAGSDGRPPSGSAATAPPPVPPSPAASPTAPAREPLHGSAASPGPPARAAAADPDGGEGSVEAAAETTAVCGPTVIAPEGVRMQTCVLSRGGETWGRMYHRNPTDDVLQGALSLMGPDGRTVQMPCTLPAGDRPGTCDTPRQRTAEPRGGQEPYLAVGEAGTPDGERVLLRAGSNSRS